jgi:prepilin-type N-terminal cleavage/methylation domain-containing protein
MPRQSGVTLIEVIVSIVLLAIVGAVAAFFFATGVRGYLTARRAADSAPKIQVALERINLELSNALDRSGTGTIAFFQNTSVEYQSSVLPGTRRIRYDSGTRRLLLHNGTAEFLLLDDVDNFVMNATTVNLDGNATNGNEVQRFDLAFQMRNAQGETPAVLPTVYGIGVMPRNFLHP